MHARTHILRRASACIFCGAQAPANYKNLQHGFVSSILQHYQLTILHLMRNVLAAEMHKSELILSKSEDVKDTEDAEESDSTWHSRIGDCKAGECAKCMK